MRKILLVFVFHLAVISNAFTLEGRWFPTRRAPGRRSICSTFDYLPRGNGSKAFQGVTFTNTSDDREPVFFSGGFSQDNRLLRYDSLQFGLTINFIYLFKPTLFIASDTKNGIFVLSRTPQEPDPAFVDSLLATLEYNFTRVLHENCRYLPISVSSLDMDAFKGPYLNVLASKKSPFANLTCSAFLYQKRRNITSTFKVFTSFQDGGQSLGKTVSQLQLEPPLFPGQGTLTEQNGEASASWILKLGPVIGGLYDYAVIAPPTLTSVIVLARNVTRFESVYKTSIIDFLVDTLTFSRSDFVDIVQNSACQYTPRIRRALARL